MERFVRGRSWRREGVEDSTIYIYIPLHSTKIATKTDKDEKDVGNQHNHFFAIIPKDLGLKDCLIDPKRFSTLAEQRA